MDTAVKREIVTTRRWVLLAALEVAVACVFIFFVPHTANPDAFLGLTTLQKAALFMLLVLEAGMFGLLWGFSISSDFLKAFQEKTHRATFGDSWFSLKNAAWLGLVSSVYLLLKWGILTDLSGYASILAIVTILLVLVAVICAEFLLSVRRVQGDASASERVSFWNQLRVLVLSPKKFTLALAVVAGILAVLSVLGQIIRFELPQVYAGVDWAASEFYLSNEMNLPTFFSAALLIFDGGLMLIIARLRSQKGQDFVRRWAVLGGIFFLLAADEVFQFHERLTEPVQNLVHGHDLLNWPWFLPLIPVLIALFFIYLKFIIRLPGKTRVLLLLSAFFYVGSALVLEAFCAWFADAHTTETLAYTLMANVEEVGEMTGSILLIYTLLDFMRPLVLPSEGTAFPDSPVV